MLVTNKIIKFNNLLVRIPQDTKNLWDDPASADIKQGLLQRMLEFYIESTVQTRDARRLIVSPASAKAMQ